MQEQNQLQTNPKIVAIGIIIGLLALPWLYSFGSGLLMAL